MYLKYKYLCLFWILFSAPLTAYQGGFTPSLSDWGGVGLLQTPNARFYEDGQFAFGPSHVFPHTLINFNMQFLPWMQATLRYIITEDRWGKGLKNYDRNMDLKFLLWHEGAYWPQCAVGFQDALGTPHFRGEYFVFSKRFYDFDFSVGLGWGRMGSRGHIRNVFTHADHRFEKRVLRTKSQGGIPGFHDFFRGKHMGVFGGVEYSTPIQGLNLKFEANGDRLFQERLNRRYHYKTPFNFGVSYQVTDWFQLRAGLEQGHQFMIGGSVMANFHKKPNHPMPPVPPVKVRGMPAPVAPQQPAAPQQAATKPTAPPSLELMAKVLFKASGMPLVALHVCTPTLTIYCENKQFRLPTVAIARIARVLTHISPEHIEFFKIILVEKGINLSETTVLRRDIENLGQCKSSPEEVLVHTTLNPAQPCVPQNSYMNKDLYPNYKPYVLPRFKQTLFDPGRAMRFQVILAGGTNVEFGPGLLGNAEIGINVYNQLDDLKRVSNSKLPHVRSDVKRYATEGRYHLSHLQFDKVAQFSPSLFGRVSTGFFESMFAGYSAELLYRPYRFPVAVGAEINHVHQRDYNQLFGFKGYEVTTGHVSFYCDLPFYDMHTNVHIGRYLARDWGATVEIMRKFETGIEVGFFTTHTNVPHNVFGEGSFDKGVWFKIPLDWILGGHYKQSFDYLMRPLSKDGGQRVHVNNRLYNMTNGHTESQIRRQFGHFAE